MMIALLADIHGNREALSACLADAERRNAARYIFLGDLVGYGADPGWVVDLVMEFSARGAVALLGNHDAAQAGFLKALPLVAQDGDRLFVHASADQPAQFHYVLDTRAARRSLDATP